MTTKPAAPKAAPKPKTIAKAVTNPEQRFWEYMKNVQAEIATMDFGSKTGRGGSELKDSHALHHFVRDKFIKDGVTYDLLPTDISVTQVNTGFLVSGNYLAKFYFNGELVYETPTFGAFDTGNSAQATHGAYTAARTSLLFNITQASVKSQDDIEAKREQHMNRQAPRTPATSGGAKPY